jgi:hypothetical protein
MPSEGIEGDEWGAYLTLTTCDRDDRGIACRARALWRQSARSSRRSHDLPGRAGKPSAGRRGTGDVDIDMAVRYAKCKTPKWCWVSSVSAHIAHGVSHQRAGCSETGQSGSAGDHAEKDLFNRNLAAWSTQFPPRAA